MEVALSHVCIDDAEEAASECQSPLHRVRVCPHLLRVPLEAHDARHAEGNVGCHQLGHAALVHAEGAEGSAAGAPRQQGSHSSAGTVGLLRG